MRIDLNCDLGESFGAYHIGDDAAIMPWITSANVACGFHGGDPLVIQATVALAAQHGVGVGAHPGFPDLQGFGRRTMQLDPQEVEAILVYQIGALAGFCKAQGVELRHVKPHGALYNQAAKNIELARAIANAVRSFSSELVFVGLAGSKLIEAGREGGLKTAAEGFADRAYNPDGSLRSRQLPGAVLTPGEAVEQALRLARHGVEILEGERTIHIPVDTLCIHGDSPGAAQIAQAVRSELENAGIHCQQMFGAV